MGHFYGAPVYHNRRVKPPSLDVGIEAPFLILGVGSGA
jgi:hypothetical protein